MTLRFRASRHLSLPIAALVLMASLPLGGAQVAEAASPDMVISQVYGGGGNSGAYWRSDFVELFNRGAAPVDLTGWTVQYTSASGSTWQKTELSGVLQPGQYYLVKQADGANTEATPLPDPDAAGTIPMSGSQGKVVLVNHSTLLTGAAPTDGVVDLVGFGGANYSEGSPTPSLTNSTAALRLSGGCVDTDQNSMDFSVASPEPRNSASPLNDCGGGGPQDLPPAVSRTVPANGASGVSPAATVEVTFTEPVTVADGWFDLTCTVSGSVATDVTGGPTAYSIRPAQPFAQGESCDLRIIAANVTDQDEAPDAMEADFALAFSILEAALRIHEVQGAGHLSPKESDEVQGVEGIVTHLRANGFFMEDPQPDGDPATSDGIYVFTSRAPQVQVGDLVQVSGRVVEFRPGGSSANNFTLTEISSPQITAISTGNPLPDPVILGTGGLPLPTDEITDGIPFWESLESMRVQVNDARAVGRRNNFGELWVLADDGDGATGLNPRGGITVTEDDFNPERIMVDADFLEEMNLGTTPMVSVGDLIADPIMGIVDYTFSNYKVQAIEPFAVSDAGLERTVAEAAGADELAVATFNVENLDAADPAEKYAQLAQLVVENLQSPDLLAIEEIQDNTGPTEDGTTDASQTWQRLIDAVASAGGPTYDYRDIAPVDGEDGGQPGGNIRVGFLFRTDRGLSFVDRPGGTATDAVAVVAGEDGPELSVSPGRIDPANPAFEESRKPLAGEFRYNDQKLFVVANHFSSKNGDDGLYGQTQPPVRHTEAQRHQQAQVVGGFVEQILAADPDANVLVLGDLNDFQFSETLSILKGAGLNNPMESLPVAEQYTYVFEGNSEALDHILMSDNLHNNATWSYEVVHVNTEFADQASDHDPQVIRVALPEDEEPEEPEDPQGAGSATGGGWIDAPDASDPEQTVKANFAFNVKLGEAASGNVVFHAGDLRLLGDTITAGGVAAARVVFEGTGRIGLEEGYAFRVEATERSGKGAKDETFRIQIWDLESGELFYDSGTQPLGGGSVQVR